MLLVRTGRRLQSLFIAFPSLYFLAIIYNQSRPFRPLVVWCRGVYSFMRGKALGGLAAGAGGGSFCGGGNDEFLWEVTGQIRVMLWAEL
jgi:hypothetical protein